MSVQPTPPVRPSRGLLGGDGAHHQATRFLLVGATTVAIDFAVYQLLLALGVPLDLAKGLSFVVATVCAYLFNRSFTFRVRDGAHPLRSFVVLYAVALAVNVGVNTAVLGLVAEGGPSRPEIVLAFLVAQVVSSTMNFLGMRHWVFASPGTRPGLRLVLASQSPARLATLRAAGLDPEVVVSGVDEDQLVTTDAEELSVELARLKATAVAERVDGEALVVGCDSVLEIDGAVHGKPVTAAAATERWQAMRGRSGTLHTGHCVVDTRTGRTVARAARTVVHFADVTDEEIAAYVATGEPLAVAGAFTIDGLGGAYVEGIEGDPHTVVGISLPLLRGVLAELGVAWHTLWRPSVR